MRNPCISWAFLFNLIWLMHVRIVHTEIAGELTRDYLSGRSNELLQRRLLMLPWQPDDVTHLSYEQHEDDDIFKAVCRLRCQMLLFGPRNGSSGYKGCCRHLLLWDFQCTKTSSFHKCDKSQPILIRLRLQIGDNILDFVTMSDF